MSDPSWPQLPPPDLTDTYRQLPQSWKTGAVLLANRILAADYRQDVLEVAAQTQRDLEAGAVRGMTADEYLEEATEGHPRVVDTNLALQCLQYSPAAQHATNEWPVGVREMALHCFRADISAELEARGVELD